MLKTLTLNEWLRLARRNPTNDHQGPSPGGVASELGMTRQSVHAAIKRGDLDAYRVLDNDSRRLRAIIITQASVERFKALRAVQNRQALA